MGGGGQLMLARIADNLYWMGRDLERASAVVRLLEVGHAAALEGALANGCGRTQVWEPVIRIAADMDRFGRRHRRAEERSVTWFLSLSDENLDGTKACLTRVRDRAGMVRDRLPIEVFEAVGAALAGVTRWTPERLVHDGLFTFCHEVRESIARVDGVMERIVRRDDRWQFIRVGRAVERAQQTARLVWEHHRMGASPSSRAGGLGDWRTMLRAAASYESYLRVGAPGSGGPAPEAFLLVDVAQPTSVAFALEQVSGGIEWLTTSGAGPAGNALPRAALAAASRTLVAAANPVSATAALPKLLTRLDDVHETFVRGFIDLADHPDEAMHAQAVHQAQN